MLARRLQGSGVEVAVQCGLLAGSAGLRGKAAECRLWCRIAGHWQRRLWGGWQRCIGLNVFNCV